MTTVPADYADPARVWRRISLAVRAAARLLRTTDAPRIAERACVPLTQVEIVLGLRPKIAPRATRAVSRGQTP